MKKIAGGAFFALLVSTACQAVEKEKPKVDREAMHGYVKQYDGCTAAWIDATQSLALSGDGCGKLSVDKVLEDAATAYLDLKKKGRHANFAEKNTQDEAPTIRYSEQEASLSAITIWKAGCSDFKSGMNAGDFQGWLRLGDAEKAHPGIRKTAVVRLYMDGWDMARNLNGMVNCGDMAISRVRDYVSGIDIRN